MSAPETGLRFEPEWRITLFTLLLVPLMISLGFWQLQRAGEKASLAASWDQRQAQGAVPVSRLWDKPAGELAYRSVELRGSYDAQRYFLLDNRIHKGRFGYEVLTVMQLDDGAGTVLVNRGWIAGDASRRQLPQVPPGPGGAVVTGHVYVAPGKPYLLQEQRLGPGWPKLLQAVEMDRVQPALGAAGRVFPYPVRIDAGAPGALTVDWQVVNVSPQKHRGYAVQWFSMAAVLAVFYLLRSSNLWQLVTNSRGKRD